MKLIETDIEDVKVIVPRVFSDARGYFKETWNAESFQSIGLSVDFVQDNQSRSVKGTLRGLHYQITQPQGKLVRVLNGSIFDVAVDIRQSSATFGKWVGRVLSADNHEMLWVPPGFAHGFCVLSDTADMLYKCTDFYAAEHERTIIWNDADLDIEWPLAEDGPPVLSEKDKNGVRFMQAEYYP